MDKGLNEFIGKMSGNSDMITKNYFDSLVIETRLIDSSLASSEIDFVGLKLAAPVMLGVIGGYGHMGENSLLNSALAAKELDTVLWVSNAQKDETLKQLVETGARIGFVCKPYADQDHFISELKRAENCGVSVLACDIDHAYAKTGNYDGRGDVMFGPKTVAQLKEAAQSVSLPFFAKGVLSIQDALKAKEAGLAGVFLSHHHNIIASAIPPVMILPEIRKAVGDDFCIVVDCGINSGTEAFKALALGADCVAVARGYMAPLAKEGKDGVVNYIRGINGQLIELMSRTGSSDPSHIDPSVIHRLF